LINELADFGKLGDVREPAVYLFGGESEDRRIEIDIVAARKFGIEAGAQFQKCGDPAIHVYSAGGRLKDAGTYLKERTFTTPVFTDDTKGFSMANIERHVAERPVVLVKLAAVEGGKLLEAIARRAVD